MVLAGSPLACIRCASAVLEASSALRPPDGLPACASGIAWGRAALPAKLQLKFGQ